MARLSPEEKARRKTFRQSTRGAREEAFVDVLAGVPVEQVIQALRGVILQAAAEADAQPDEMIHVQRAMAVIFGTIRFLAMIIPGIAAGIERGR
jgi:hypothetical protein